MSALSCWLLFETYQLGVSRSLLARLIANMLLEGAAATVQVERDLFDIGWRANRRNVLLKHFEREGLL